MRCHARNKDLVRCDQEVETHRVVTDVSEFGDEEPLHSFTVTWPESECFDPETARDFAQIVAPHGSEPILPWAEPSSESEQPPNVPDTDECFSCSCSRAQHDLLDETGEPVGCARHQCRMFIA